MKIMIASGVCEGLRSEKAVTDGNYALACVCELGDRVVDLLDGFVHVY